MGEIIYSFCKDGKRYDRPQSEIEIAKGGPGSGRYPRIYPVKLDNESYKDSGALPMYYQVALKPLAEKLLKQEPIAEDSPVISRGAIVTLRGHKGKVLETEGEVATVSWEDASLSKVPIADLKYEGRVEKQIKSSDMHHHHNIEHRKHFPNGFNDGENDAKAGKPKAVLTDKHKSYQAGYYTGYHAVQGAIKKGGPGSGVYERGEGRGGYPKKDKVPAGVRSRMARIKEGAEQRMKERGARGDFVKPLRSLRPR